MTILVVGASGATGHLLVQQLLDRDETVRVIVRSAERLPPALRHHNKLAIIEASILELDEDALAACVADCKAIACCLGHNLTFKGIFGPPRKLVTDACRRLGEAVIANNPASPVKVVLMNTTGNRNRDQGESIGLAERIIIALLRLLVPPHADNETAADYLRVNIGQQHPCIEWAAVRPDTLIDDAMITDYAIHPSPTRSAIFDSGESSRINVAHFMATLILDNSTWEQWRGQMPVIYNKARQA